MNRVRIAHGSREVVIDADGPLLDAAAAALHAWTTCWPDQPAPERPPFGITTDHQPEVVVNTSLADTAILPE